MIDFNDPALRSLPHADILIPSLKAIYILPCAWLSPDMRMIAITPIKAVVAATPVMLPFFGEASLASEATSRDLSAKTTLSFRAAAPVDAVCPVAFVAATHDDRFLLVGAAEPPFPKVTSAATTGQSPASTREVQVTVEWSSRPIDVLLPMRPHALPPLP